MLFRCTDVVEILVVLMLLSNREIKNSHILHRVDNGGRTRSTMSHWCWRRWWCSLICWARSVFYCSRWLSSCRTKVTTGFNPFYLHLCVCVFRTGMLRNPWRSRLRLCSRGTLEVHWCARAASMVQRPGGKDALTHSFLECTRLCPRSASGSTTPSSATAAAKMLKLTKRRLRCVIYSIKY